MDDSQLDYLDEVAAEASHGNFQRVGPLSTGQRLYVALASGKLEEIAPDYTIVQALARLDAADVDALIKRWEYRSLPA